MRQAEVIPVMVADQEAQVLIDRLAPGLYDEILRIIGDTRNGVGVSSVQVRSTAEGDDPNWVELLLEVTVTAEREAASNYWDRISDSLESLMDSSEGQARDQIIRLISVIVRRS